MTPETVMSVAQLAIETTLMVAGPMLLLSLTVGLCVGAFQAMTQINEATLTFVPKIIIIFVSVMLFLPFMLATLSEFASFLFDRIIGLG